MESKLHKQINSTAQIVDTQVGKEDKVPPGVTNKEAWYKWLELKNSILLSKERRVIQTSDPATDIDLCVPLNATRKRMAHLPQKEREDIEKRTKAYRVLTGKMSAMKNKAFGIKQKGLYSHSERILDPRVSEIVEYFGRFYSADEVLKIVRDDWGYPVSKSLLNNFRKAHIDKIQERQEEYKRDYSDIRLGYKKSRLEELEYIYNNRKNKYEVNHSHADEKQLLSIIKQIKDEVEVDTLRIEGNINHNLEVNINMHVQQEAFKEMTINDIIIGRVAARQNISAAYLIERLHRSFYAKHSGFGKTDGHVNDQDIQYPSSIVYNWSTIEKMHQKESHLIEEARRPKDIEDVEIIEETTTLKESLLAKVRSKKAEINKSQSRVDEK